MADKRTIRKLLEGKFKAIDDNIRRSCGQKEGEMRAAVHKLAKLEADKLEIAFLGVLESAGYKVKYPVKGCPCREKQDNVRSLAETVADNSAYALASVRSWPDGELKSARLAYDKYSDGTAEKRAKQRQRYHSILQEMELNKPGWEKRVEGYLNEIWTEGDNQ